MWRLTGTFPVVTLGYVVGAAVQGLENKLYILVVPVRWLADTVL
jgi:hypothetical protein